MWDKNKGGEEGERIICKITCSDKVEIYFVEGKRKVETR